MLTTLSTQLPQKRAWPHGLSVTPSRCPIRHTSRQLSAAAAGVAVDVEVVPVAAAGIGPNAVADGMSSASSSSLEDSLWRGCRAPACVPTLRLTARRN